MAETPTNLTVLRETCIELMSSFDEFWILAALTDASYEEGERSSDFKRSIDRYAQAGAPEWLLKQLRNGINGNLRAVLERANPTLGRVIRNVGKGQDLSYDAWKYAPAASIEVKLVYDCTLPKYYPSVAADWDKLASLRSKGFSGDLFLTVFFVQMPRYEYPAGRWAGRSRDSLSRQKYLCHCGIAAQFSTLTRALPHSASWPLQGSPYVRKLTALIGEPLEVGRRRFEDFQPTVSWQFNAAQHLEDASVGAAIWQIP
jgi:hypothetical protein